MVYSIIIQGPLNRISLEHIEEYSQFGRVIISYWNEDDESILDDFDISACQLIKKPLPNPVYFSDRWDLDTFTYQINGIYNGAYEANTPYVVRTRSDEFFSLEPLIRRFKANVSKVVCGNIFFKKWNVFRYHFGDHIFVAQRDLVLRAYYDLIDDHQFYKNAYCPEIAASLALMKAAGLEETRENFIELFDVIDINKLNPFKAAWRHYDIIYDNVFNHEDCIKTMEELCSL